MSPVCPSRVVITLEGQRREEWCGLALGACGHRAENKAEEHVDMGTSGETVAGASNPGGSSRAEGRLHGEHLESEFPQVEPPGS